MAGNIVTGYAKMWPRGVFDVKDRGKYPDNLKDRLRAPGVYVLYRDDQPCCFGKTKRASLFNRIKRHAVRPRDPYYNFWNFFSAFTVPQASHIDEVEAVLIAGMPSANRANPKIKRIQFPKEVGRILYKRPMIDMK